jgi:hypothetical protein
MLTSLLSTSRYFAKKQPVNLLVQRSFNSCKTQLRDFIEAPLTKTSRAPLEGIRVLDLTRVLGKVVERVYHKLSVIFN